VNGRRGLVTTLRLALLAAEGGLCEIHSTGTQSGLLERIQRRSRLYELLRYADYYEFDTPYNFTVQEGTDDTERHADQ
jgi:methylisocitrate lyase